MTCVLSPPPDVVAIVGATASGKTALSLELARRLDTEIISADSMQVYKGMEIGTAAPTWEERAKIIHHFVGFLSPLEQFSAGAFGTAARDVIAALNQRGRIALLVGGSGLYLRAVIDGLFPGPARDETIRARLHAEAEQGGVQILYERLQSIDPDYAKVILPGDLRRIVRALEVYELTGKPISTLHRLHQNASSSLRVLQIGLDVPREILYRRINERVERMLACGFLDEVRTLLAQGYGERFTQLRTLGYREFADYLQGKCSYEEALEAMKRNTRRYARRQLIWFRGDSRIQWIPVSEEITVSDLADRAIKLIRA